MCRSGESYGELFQNRTTYCARIEQFDGLHLRNVMARSKVKELSQSTPFSSYATQQMVYFQRNPEI